MGYVWVGALLSAQGLVWLLQFAGLSLLVLSAGVLSRRLIHRRSAGQSTPHPAYVDSPTGQAIKPERATNVAA
jgi:membrane protein implicated in regulation of membrane protease activity